MESNSLPKSDIIRESQEFRNVLFNGKRKTDLFFHCKIKPTDKNRSRLGVVVSKKVGTAVLRNKIKRITRETFRLNRKKLHENADFVFLFRTKIKKDNIKDLKKHIESFIIKL